MYNGLKMFGMQKGNFAFEMQHRQSISFKQHYWELKYNASNNKASSLQILFSNNNYAQPALNGFS